MDKSNRHDYNYDPSNNNESLEPLHGQDEFSTDFEGLLYDPSIQHLYQPYLSLNYPQYEYHEGQIQYHLPDNFNQAFNPNSVHFSYNTLPPQLFPEPSGSQYPPQQEQTASSSSRKEQDVFNELTCLAKKDVSRSPRPKEQKHFSKKSSKGLTGKRYSLDKYRRSHQEPTPSESKMSYQLKIVQQPSRARMCGFGDKDRRSVVPTPIIQLFVKDQHGKEIDIKTFDATFLVVMCDSCLMEKDSSAPLTRKASLIPQPQVNVFSTVDKSKGTNHYVKNLIGTTVASAYKLYDLEENLGIFFVFHDLSVRTEGMFHLKFSLIDVNPSLNQGDKDKPLSTVIETVYSDPLTVYSAKKYPGVLQASPLSLYFSQQGVKIPIRKETKKADEHSHSS